MKNQRTYTGDPKSDWINGLLEMGKDCYLDVQALIEDRLLVNANSGGGKSRTLRKIIELVYGHAQVIVFDIEGEFHTLREKFSFTLCGPEGEAPATVSTASKLSERLLKLGKSAVIDVSELLPGEQEAYIASFIETWMRATRAQWHDTVFVLDECNKYCPEGRLDPKSSLGRCQEAIVDLMRRGRKRGFAGVLATQRIADLNKRAIAECNSVMLGRCAVDVDIDRSAKMLGMRKGDAVEQIPQLRPGEFFVYGRAVIGSTSADGQRVSRIQVGDVSTTHPKRGQRIPVTPAPAEVKRALAELSDIATEAEAEVKEIDRLRARVAELEAKPAKGVNGSSAPGAAWTVVVGPDAQAQIAKAKAATDELRGKYVGEQVAHSKTQAELAATRRTVLTIKSSLAHLVETLTIPDGAAPVVLLAPGPGKGTSAPPPAKHVRKSATPAAPVKPPAREARATKDPGDPSLDEGEQRIMEAIAWMESIGNRAPSRSAVGFIADYTVAGGTFRRIVGGLRTRGMIDYQGDTIVFTDLGRAAAPKPASPGSGPKLRETVLSRLPEGEQRLLNPLIDAYPQNVTFDQLAELSQYDAAGGTFRRIRGRLRSLGIATYPVQGHARAADMLFPEAMS